MRDFNSKELDESGEDVDSGCERGAPCGCSAGPRDHQLDVAQRLVDGDIRLAPDVSFAKVMPVVRAHYNDRIIPEIVTLDRLDHAAEPGIDHRQFGAVTGAYLVRLPLG